MPRKQHKAVGNKKKTIEKRQPKKTSKKGQRQSTPVGVKGKKQKGVSLFKIIPDEECGQNAVQINDDQFIEEDNEYKQDNEEYKQEDNEYRQEDNEQQGEYQNQEEYQEQRVQKQQNEQVKEQDEMVKEESNNEAVDISVIALQIQQTLSIISNVGRLGNGLPRSHYMDKLKQLLHQYYGYNHQLIEHLIAFMNPMQLVQFMQANETARPVSIRTNTLKTRRKDLAQCLMQRGVSLDPLSQWSSVGIKIYGSKVPLGATPQYLAGQYMLQSASSLLPVLALDPQPQERVLDLAAAPGGKTTYIAQLMHNTGCLIANDMKKQRLKALQFNLYRMGVSNAAVTCKDGRKYPQWYPHSFDRVLLDAPCTGLGIIAKDPSIKANRMLIDIYKNSHLQKQLLLAAIDCTKLNGVIVYSTCSVSPLENEEVVNYALKKRFVKVVQCGIDVGEEGLTKFGEKRYSVDLKMCRRIYPHVHNMDGFFVCKLVKVAKGIKVVQKQE